MTISHSNPTRYIGSAIKYLIGAIVICAIVLIFLYNQMVQVRQTARAATKQVDQLTTQNATLKNQLYTMIDTRQLIMNVERLGYIKDSNPAYLTFLADGSVREGSRVSLLER